MEALFLKPACMHNIWGGSKLREEFGYPIEGSDIGECWGISAHPQGDGIIREGEYRGKTLSAMWTEHPELFGNLNYDRYPLLTKIIDAQDDLSIQVHPDDAYAQAHENGSLGKTECWYIMDCKEDATIVIGHNAKTKAELISMVREGRWGELIREIPIHRGISFRLIRGTVHAIKAHTLILETQQNSAVTYRLYDYGRLQNGKARELHLDKSLDVITVPAKKAEECVKSAAGLPENVLNTLYVCDKYGVYKLDVRGETAFEQNDPFLAVSVLEGRGSLNGKEIHKGDHFILPCGYGEVKLSGEMSLICATVKRA